MNKTIIDQEKEFSIRNEDWSVAKIKYELETRRLSLAGLSRDAGYSETAAGRALRTSWPALENIIANAVGVTPETIWPSRYVDGVPRSYVEKRRGRPRKSEAGQ